MYIQRDTKMKSIFASDYSKMYTFKDPFQREEKMLSKKYKIIRKIIKLNFFLIEAKKINNFQKKTILKSSAK